MRLQLYTHQILLASDPYRVHKKSWCIKVVTAKMSLSLSISGHTLVMESPQLSPRVKLFESFSSLKALTLGPS